MNYGSTVHRLLTQRGPGAVVFQTSHPAPVPLAAVAAIQAQFHQVDSKWFVTVTHTITTCVQSVIL